MKLASGFSLTRRNTWWNGPMTVSAFRRELWNSLRKNVTNTLPHCRACWVPMSRHSDLGASEYSTKRDKLDSIIANWSRRILRSPSRCTLSTLRAKTVRPCNMEYTSCFWDISWRISYKTNEVISFWSVEQFLYVPTRVDTHLPLLHFQIKPPSWAQTASGLAASAFDGQRWLAVVEE